MGWLVSPGAFPLAACSSGCAAPPLTKFFKRAFLKEAPIEGSWIEMKKSPLQKFALRTDVYYGGITRYEDGQLVQYEFLADANTGSILDIYRL